MQTLDGFVEIRAFVNAKLQYRMNGFGVGYEAEQNVEDVLKEILEMIDRVGGKVIAEQVLVGTSANQRPFVRAARYHAQALRARMEFVPCAAPRKGMVTNLK
jgi:hypothetical protein